MTVRVVPLSWNCAAIPRELAVMLFGSGPMAGVGVITPHSTGPLLTLYHDNPRALLRALSAGIVASARHGVAWGRDLYPSPEFVWGFPRQGGINPLAALPLPSALTELERATRHLGTPIAAQVSDGGQQPAAGGPCGRPTALLVTALSSSGCAGLRGDFLTDLRGVLKCSPVHAVVIEFQL